MEMLLAVFAGYFFGLTSDKTMFVRIHKYFASPTSRRLELSWSVRQLLMLVSESAAQRWYEARAHLHRGVFISTLCALHLIYLVRVDFGVEDDDNRFVWTQRTYHGFRSFDKLAKLVESQTSEIQASTKNAKYYHQTFVAGYNIIGDFMNSYA